MTKSIKYTVCSLDVWGNTEEGYDVNDSHKIGTIELDPEISDAAIIQALIDAEFLDSCALDLAEVECFDGLIHIYEKADCRPVLNLLRGR
jgi:hypothetical protein